MNLRILSASAALLALPLAPAALQFAPGDVVLRSAEPTAGVLEIYRVDPVSGHGEMLMSGMYAGFSGADWLAYDSHRGGLLAYTSYGSLWASPKLWLVRGPGQITELGHLGAQFTGLAPVGDGRVYLRKAGKLHVLDAQNQLTPVVDVATGLPAALEVDHLCYDPALNALIGAGNYGLIASCAGPGLVPVVRYDLSADGLQVVGTACGAYAFGDGAAATGLDRMPDGSMLLSLSDGYVGDDNLLRVDPATLAVTLYAEVSPSYNGGAVWSQALGQALLLDNSSNVLRSYAPGSSGMGTVHASDVLFPSGASSGWSTQSRFTDVDVLGPTCAGSATQWGAGLAGSGGFAPLLGAGGCPRIGAALPLTLGLARGGAQGLLLVGVQSGAVPVYGGTLHALPPYVLQAPFVVGGAGFGQGFAQVTVPVPSQPSLIGVPVHAQAGVLDSGAAQGVALSNALEIVLG